MTAGRLSRGGSPTARSGSDSWLLGALSASIFCRVSSISISILLFVIGAASDVLVVAERADFFRAGWNALETNA